MARNDEIHVTLSGMTLSPKQRKTLANAVSGAIVSSLSHDSKKDLLVRRPTVSVRGIKIEIAHVGDGGAM